jgi:endonuclease-3
MARTSKGKTRKSTSKVKKEPVKASSSHAVRPTAEECIYATVSLAKLHPHVVDKNEERRKTLLESCGLRDSITDSVISTMLSQNTTDKNSKQAWGQLKKAFPEWEAVCDPKNLPKVEAAIKVAGLAKTRAERIHKMLCQVRDERGVPSLDYLREISDDEQVKRELLRFKGIFIGILLPF